MSAKQRVDVVGVGAQPVQAAGVESTLEQVGRGDQGGVGIGGGAQPGAGGDTEGGKVDDGQHGRSLEG